MNRETFAHYTQQFLDFLAHDQDASAHTCRAYASDLRQYIHWWSSYEERSGHPIILDDAVRAFSHDLLQMIGSSRSAARKLSCISSYVKFLESCVGQRIPFAVPRPEQEESAPVILSRDSMQTLLTLKERTLSSMRPYRDKAILHVLYATGMRCCELVALKLADITWEHNSITIKHPHKRDRTIALSEETMKAIKLYINRERKKAQSLNEYLFLNSSYEPLTTRSIQRICNQFSRHIDEQLVITPHMLRHTCAVHRLEDGMDALDLQYMLGHATRLHVDRYVRMLRERSSADTV